MAIIKSLKRKIRQACWKTLNCCISNKIEIGITDDGVAQCINQMNVW